MNGPAKRIMPIMALPIELLHHIAKHLQRLDPYTVWALASTNRLMRQLAGPLASQYMTIKGGIHAVHMLNRATASTAWATTIRGITLFHPHDEPMDPHWTRFFQSFSLLFPQCTEVELAGEWSTSPYPGRCDAYPGLTSCPTVRTLKGTTIAAEETSLSLPALSTLFPSLEELDLSASDLRLSPKRMNFGPVERTPEFPHVHTFLLSVDPDIPGVLNAWSDDAFPHLRSLTVSTEADVDWSALLSYYAAIFFAARLTTVEELAITTSLESWLWEELYRTAEPHPELHTLKAVLGTVEGLHAVLGFIALTNSDMDAEIRYSSSTSTIDIETYQEELQELEVGLGPGGLIDLPGVRVQETDDQRWYTLNEIRSLCHAPRDERRQVDESSGTRRVCSLGYHSQGCRDVGGETDHLAAVPQQVVSAPHVGTIHWE